MGRYAEKTEVTSDKSRAEIERTLVRYGADQFMYGWQDNSAVVAFRAKNRRVRFVLPLPSRESPEFTSYKQGSVLFRRAETEIARRYEQAVRQRWRALALVVKAKLEAVEAGITTFDEEFLAHILLPDGKSVGEWMQPQVERAYQLGTMPSVLPMLEHKPEDVE